MKNTLQCIDISFTLVVLNAKLWSLLKREISQCIAMVHWFWQCELCQEPHLEKAINSVRFVAQHVKNQDRYNKVNIIVLTKVINVKITNFIIINFIMINFIMINFIMINVIMINVIMINVIIISVIITIIAFALIQYENCMSGCWWLEVCGDGAGQVKHRH